MMRHQEERLILHIEVILACTRCRDEGFFVTMSIHVADPEPAEVPCVT